MVKAFSLVYETVTKDKRTLRVSAYIQALTRIEKALEALGMYK